MQVLQTQGLLENEYPFEFAECFQSGVVQGRLCFCIDFWCHINCSDFILDLIDDSCKILFENAPTGYSFENRGSTINYNDFASESILELFERGCVKELSNPSEFCNPLHVAAQSSGKLRLILDLSHLNTMVVKKSFKGEDLSTVLQIFDKRIYAFTFYLKSAYHHIDICDDHVKYLSFKWSFGSGKFRHIKP